MNNIRLKYNNYRTHSGLGYMIPAAFAGIAIPHAPLRSACRIGESAEPSHCSARYREAKPNSYNKDLAYFEYMR
jgi:hypothetical protein